MAEITQIFTQAIAGVLDSLRAFTGSYGWAIVIFATLVKLALYYPTQKQYQSMKEMQRIQPMVKKLQDKYKNDPQKLQMEQMELFKKYKVNPLGGCLPLIIQMPILIGIFTTIRQMVAEGKFANETFLWIGSNISTTNDFIAENLAQSDVPLLLLYGLSMFLSQKTTVSDPSQEQTQKMMTYVMPIAFTAILWKFQSALILYWLVFNLWSIVQQYIVMKSGPSGEEVKTEQNEIEKVTEDNTDSDSEETSDSSKSGRSRSRSRKKKGGK